VTSFPFLAASEIEPHLSWREAVAAIEKGHRLPRADVDDAVVARGVDGLLIRAGWVRGLGAGAKTVTVFPGNTTGGPRRPSVQGVFILFDEQTGAVKALMDSGLITKWKTAADSVLGARYLARANATRLLIVGAGAVAAGLAAAYRDWFPKLKDISVWARDDAKAKAFADSYGVRPVSGALADAVAKADIIATATSSTSPVLKGEQVSAGAHVDLVGAYRADMREADNTLMAKGRIFVDSRETTLDHIGELAMPIAQGAITAEDVCGDLYELAAGGAGRQSPDDITIFKNGGGAHLDIMIADYICRTAGLY
jgi:ornithine cyclodeaminase